MYASISDHRYIHIYIYVLSFSLIYISWVLDTDSPDSLGNSWCMYIHDYISIYLHRRNEVDISIVQPTLLVPLNCHDPNTQVIVADLTSLTFKSKPKPSLYPNPAPSPSSAGSPIPQGVREGLGNLQQSSMSMVAPQGRAARHYDSFVLQLTGLFLLLFLSFFCLCKTVQILNF